jgi:hypothetical protein
MREKNVPGARDVSRALAPAAAVAILVVHVKVAIHYGSGRRWLIGWWGDGGGSGDVATGSGSCSCIFL